jgi:F-type H+-transporting ATPase subunit epsilon
LATVDADKVKADIQGFEEKLGNLSEDDARRAYLYNEIAWCKLKLAQ